MSASGQLGYSALQKYIQPDGELRSHVFFTCTLHGIQDDLKRSATVFCMKSTLTSDWISLIDIFHEILGKVEDLFRFFKLVWRERIKEFNTHHNRQGRINNCTASNQTLLGRI
jgi:hypothetical protein